MDAGGYPLAWKYIQEKGVVTDACMPYNLTKACFAQLTIVTAVINKLYKVKEFKKIYGGANVIKNEIVKHGPVQATFYVYEDFMHYHSGIYRYQNGKLLGLHAVKVVGYNTSNTATNATNYWIVATVGELVGGNEWVFLYCRGRMRVRRKCLRWHSPCHVRLLFRSCKCHRFILRSRLCLCLCVCN